MIKKKDLLKRIACITSAVVVTLSATLCVGNLAERVTANAYSNLTGQGQPIFGGLGQDYIIQMDSGFNLSTNTLDNADAFVEGLGHANIAALMTITDGDSNSFTMAVQLTNDYNVYSNFSAVNCIYVNYISDFEQLRIVRPYLFYWNGYNPYFVGRDCSIFITGYNNSSPLGSFFEFYYSSDSNNSSFPNPFRVHTNIAEVYYNNYYITGYQQGESRGYQSGFQDGQEIAWQNGYNDGLSDGYEQATAEGDFSWNSFFSAFIDVPINAFTSLLNFEILGVNILSVIGSLLSVALLIVILKFLF